MHPRSCQSRPADVYATSDTQTRRIASRTAAPSVWRFARHTSRSRLRDLQALQGFTRPLKAIVSIFYQLDKCCRGQFAFFQALPVHS